MAAAQIRTWGLIGHGNIGREIQRQIGQPHVATRLGLQPQPDIIVESSGITHADGQVDTTTPFAEIALPDVTLPGNPFWRRRHTRTHGYVSTILAQGKMAVTAEKGALSHFFSDLKSASDDFTRFGITATVGGGTRMLRVAEQYNIDQANITEMHAVLNGTMTAIMSEVAPATGAGIRLEEAVEHAVAAGFAEPGANTPQAVLRGEAEGDIPKKMSIIYNVLGLGETIVTPEMLEFSLSDDDINTAVSATEPHRFIASFYPTPTASDPGPRLGGFDITIDGWRLVAGFRPLASNPLFASFAPLVAAGNGLVIGLGPNLSDGVYTVTGPGAGVEPTVNAMIDDYVRLSRLDNAR
jgi:homoserine dehydrogenase